MPKKTSADEAVKPAPSRRGRTKKEPTSKKKRLSSGTRRTKTPRLNEEEQEGTCPVVGIGASAGGLEAFERFFTHMPPDTGMAFVVIQHLDPKHKSILSELVRRYTGMTVHEVEDGMVVEPDTIYVIPPNRNMALLHGNLHLLEQSEIPGLRTPIDFFFRSLAEDRKEQSICIVTFRHGNRGGYGVASSQGRGRHGHGPGPRVGQV